MTHDSLNPPHPYPWCILCERYPNSDHSGTHACLQSINPEHGLYRPGGEWYTNEAYGLPASPDVMRVRAIAERAATLRMLVLCLAPILPTLRWRVHGIGLLQAYLIESDPEIRVHIWCESLLRKPGIQASGAIHDHRFDLTSLVLTGGITHSEYTLEENQHGEWQKWQVPNARAFAADRTSQRAGDLSLMGAAVVPGTYSRDSMTIRGDEDPNTFGDLQEACRRSQERRAAQLVGGIADGGVPVSELRYAADVRTCRVPTGYRYSFPRGVFHQATAEDYTVTLVTKYNQQTTPATILAPVGTQPEHAFKWEIHPDVIAGIVADTAARLRAAYLTERVS
jgi:hypothetical protein